jgi:hypothetical protein
MMVDCLSGTGLREACYAPVVTAALGIDDSRVLKSAPVTKILFVGSAGAGKTTLLNALLGGDFFGTSATKEVEEIRPAGFLATFVDTPGVPPGARAGEPVAGWLAQANATEDASSHVGCGVLVFRDLDASVDAIAEQFFDWTVPLVVAFPPGRASSVALRTLEARLAKARAKFAALRPTSDFVILPLTSGLAITELRHMLVRFAQLGSQAASARVLAVRRAQRLLRQARATMEGIATNASRWAMVPLQLLKWAIQALKTPRREIVKALCETWGVHYSTELESSLIDLFDTGYLGALVKPLAYSLIPLVGPLVAMAVSHSRVYTKLMEFGSAVNSLCFQARIRRPDQIDARDLQLHVERSAVLEGKAKVELRF